MIPYTLIQDDAGLAALVERLRADGVTRLAIDVEGENNLHAYGIHVALIQLFDGKNADIVDVLALRDRTLLKGLLENAPWTLVWFDAANDLLAFQHALSLRPSPLRDLAVAARLLGREGGLHALTGQPGSSSAKDRFQKANWMRRPLAPELLDYAISDVEELLRLDDELTAELEARGLAAEFAERNRESQELVRTWDPMANYVRIPGYGSLSKERQRLARQLWYARELYGREHDLPPANVASKEQLRALVDKGTRTADDIAAFLNNGRKSLLVDPVSLGDHLAEAAATLAAEPPAAPAPGDERQPLHPGHTPAPQGARSQNRGRRRVGGGQGGNGMGQEPRERRSHGHGGQGHGGQGRGGQGHGGQGQARTHHGPSAPQQPGGEPGNGGAQGGSGRRRGRGRRRRR